MRGEGRGAEDGGRGGARGVSEGLRGLRQRASQHAVGGAQVSPATGSTAAGRRRRQRSTGPPDNHPRGISQLTLADRH